MGRWSDFFAMSKHERRGALVLLLLVAMVVGMFFMSRCVHGGDVAIDPQKVETFDQQTDSAVGLMNQPRHKKTKGKKKSGDSRDSTKTHAPHVKKGKRSAEKKGGKSSPQRDINREVPRLPQED